MKEPKAPSCSLCHSSDGLTATDPNICFVCKRLRNSVREAEARDMREFTGEP